MKKEDQGELTPVEIRGYFVRGRNCMLVRGRFQDLYMDCYLHQMQHGLKNPPDLDEPFKDALAALTLHLASLPAGEGVAWTWHRESPLANIFVTGDNTRRAVTGRIFDQDVRETGKDLLIAQRVRATGAAQTSTVDITGQDIFRAVETYYRDSEQRAARFFTVGEEDYVLITAQPQADEEWLASLDDKAVGTIDQGEVLSLLETREYRFDCGCKKENMIDILNRLPESERVEIFEQEATIRMQCPRCGAWYNLSRDDLGL